MAFMKVRQTTPGTLYNQVQARKQQPPAKRVYPSGQFDRFVPGERSTWIAIPPQQYTFESFNRETRQIDTVEALFYEYRQHFVPSKIRAFVCSGGARRDKPCFGCAIRNRFFDTQREKERATGIREQAFAPVSNSLRYSLAVFAMENYVQTTLLDKQGKPRMTRAGQPITQWVPATSLGKAAEGLPSKLGHPLHWSMGPEHLQMLADFDNNLRVVSATTGTPLVAVGLRCGSCESVLGEYPGGVRGEDLLALRQEVVGCPACGEHAPGLPTYIANEPEGSITAVNLRVKATKIGDRKTVLGLTETSIRTQALDEFLPTMLDIPAIFAPSTLDTQTFMLGDMAKTINPNDAIHAEAYSNTEEPEGEEVPF